MCNMKNCIYVHCFKLYSAYSAGMAMRYRRIKHYYYQIEADISHIIYSLTPFDLFAYPTSAIIMERFHVITNTGMMIHSFENHYLNTITIIAQCELIKNIDS